MIEIEIEILKYGYNCHNCGSLAWNVSGRNMSAQLQLYMKINLSMGGGNYGNAAFVSISILLLCLFGNKMPVKRNIT